MKTLPTAVASIPEVPKNGNYILLGHNRWAHAESFAEAWGLWSEAVKCADDTDETILDDIVVLDVSDDFRIGHVWGDVSATKVDELLRRGEDWAE